MDGSANANRTGLTYLPVVIAFGLLGGIAADRILFHQPMGDAGPYHAEVKMLAEAIPMRVGDWFGTDIKQPQESVALLKPNIIISRRYENIRDGRSITFLLVHCRDSHDLTGHYPPNCYPSQGWDVESRVPRVWNFEDWCRIEGMEYSFRRERFAGSSGIVIYNFMILPTGEMVGDMRALYSAASDTRTKHFGAGQIQFISDESLDDGERISAFEEFMVACRPVIDAIRSGARQ